MNKNKTLSQEIDSTLTTELDSLNSQEMEIDYKTALSGPLYFDDRHKKPGYVYEFVADRPGDIETKLRLGYEVVKDEIKVGDTTASKTSRYGSAVTVQSKCGTLLVLMAIHEERKKKFDEYLDKTNRDRYKALTSGQIDKVPTEYQQVDGRSLGGLTTRRG